MENKFLKPKTIEETVNALSTGENLVIAGGTDLMVHFHENKEIPEHLSIVDISSLAQLKGIYEHQGKIRIGAACTHNEIEKNELIQKQAPILAKACSLVGSTPIRNRGTIGGNIINNATCADSIPPLLLLGGNLHIESIRGKRVVDIKDFFLEKEKVQLEKDELVTEIEFEPLAGYKWKLEKVGRRKSLAISRLTLAIAIKEENGILRDLRICPGAILPKHSRLWTTESDFKEKNFTLETIEAIAERATEEAISICGRRWSTEYKEPVLKGLILRALENML